MDTLIRAVAVGAFALGLVAVAHAQSLAPTVPNPANPTPLNPVATDGTPLPRHNAGGAFGLLTGRSVFAPAGVAGPVDAYDASALQD